MSENNEQLLLGKIIGTHGIKGQLKVVPFSGEPDTLVSLKSILLKDLKGQMDAFVVTAAAAHGKKALLTLSGFSTINQVQHLVGREVYARRDQLPELSPGEFYWFELIGLTVATVGGVTLGKLAEIFATGSNDVYVVTGGEKEYLIPALEEVVLQIDLVEGVMTVDPPEGLLDL